MSLGVTHSVRTASSRESSSSIPEASEINAGALTTSGIPIAITGTPSDLLFKEG